MTSRFDTGKDVGAGSQTFPPPRTSTLPGIINEPKEYKEMTREEKNNAFDLYRTDPKEPQLELLDTSEMVAASRKKRNRQLGS